MGMLKFEEGFVVYEEFKMEGHGASYIKVSGTKEYCFFKLFSYVL